MESFDQKRIASENEIETIERQESFEFVNIIKKNVVETFPFLSENEKDNFVKKLDLILGEDDVLDDPILLVEQIRLVIATLDNSHTTLKENQKEKRYIMRRPIYYKANTFWIDTDNGICEVVSLNSVPIGVLVEEERKKIGGGTNDWQIDMALESVIASNNESDVDVGIKNSDGGIGKMEVGFTDKPRLKNLVEGKMLSDNIGYLNITSWSNQAKRDGKNIAELVEEEMDRLKESSSIIIDVRQNGGGNSDFAEKIAGHFVDIPRQYCRVLKRVEGRKDLVEKKLTIYPQGEFLNKKVIILIGSKCLSSNEMFVLMLKDTGRAVAIGQTTGGGSGNPKSFDMHMGGRDFRLNVSTWRLIRNNGQELEGVGIEPDIPVEITKDDVVWRRDVELEKAIEYLKK